MEEVILKKDEKIIKEIKPHPSLKWYFFIINFFPCFLFLFIIFWTTFPLIKSYFLLKNISYFYPEEREIGLSFFVILFLVLFLGVAFISFIISHLMYQKRYYWITNKRVILKKGIIGYTLDSVPFNRISDVIISRSFLERIFGFGSVLLQTLAGQYSFRGRFGAEFSLLGLSQPEEIQRLIFELIEKEKKEILV